MAGIAEVCPGYTRYLWLGVPEDSEEQRRLDVGEVCVQASSAVGVRNIFGRGEVAKIKKWVSTQQPESVKYDRRACGRTSQAKEYMTQSLILE
jgi:hypothetical protein